MHNEFPNQVDKGDFVKGVNSRFNIILPPKLETDATLTLLSFLERIELFPKELALLGELLQNYPQPVEKPPQVKQSVFRVRAGGIRKELRMFNQQYNNEPNISIQQQEFGKTNYSLVIEGASHPIIDQKIYYLRNHLRKQNLSKKFLEFLERDLDLTIKQKSILLAMLTAYPNILYFSNQIFNNNQKSTIRVQLRAINQELLKFKDENIWSLAILFSKHQDGLFFSVNNSSEPISDNDKEFFLAMSKKRSLSKNFLHFAFDTNNFTKTERLVLMSILNAYPSYAMFDENDPFYVKTNAEALKAIIIELRKKIAMFNRDNSEREIVLKTKNGPKYRLIVKESTTD